MISSYASPRKPSPLSNSPAVPHPLHYATPLRVLPKDQQPSTNVNHSGSLQDISSNIIPKIDIKEASSGGWKSFTKRLGGTVRRKNTQSAHRSGPGLDSPISILQASGIGQPSPSHPQSNNYLQFLLPQVPESFVRSNSYESGNNQVNDTEISIELEIRKFVQKHIATNWCINLDSVPGPVYYLIETMASHLHHARKLFHGPGDINRVENILKVFSGELETRTDLSLEHPCTLAEALLRYLRSYVPPVINDPELYEMLLSATSAYKRQLLKLQERKLSTPEGLLTIFGDSSQAGAITTASAFHISSLLRTLGATKLDLVVYIISFLYHIVQRKNNDVDPAILSSIFVPILFGPDVSDDFSDVLRLMIEQWPAISGVDISACIFELQMSRSQTVSSEGVLDMQRQATLATSASQYSEEDRSLAETAVSSQNGCRDRYNTSPTQAARRLTLTSSGVTSKSWSTDGLSRASSFGTRVKLANIELECSSSQLTDLVSLINAVTPKSFSKIPPVISTAEGMDDAAASMTTLPLKTPQHDQFAPLPTTSVVKRKRMQEEIVELRADLEKTRKERDEARLALRMIRNTVGSVDLD